MAALGNVGASTTGTTLNSSSATPLDVTLNPEGWTIDGVAQWVDRSGGVPLGYPRTTFKLRPPTKESPVYKMSSKFFMPVLETVDPATGIFGPKLAYELQAHLDVMLPARSTAAERTKHCSLFRSWLMGIVVGPGGTPSPVTNSPITVGWINLEGVY